MVTALPGHRLIRLAKMKFHRPPIIGCINFTGFSMQPSMLFHVPRDCYAGPGWEEVGGWWWPDLLCPDQAANLNGRFAALCVLSPDCPAGT